MSEKYNCLECGKCCRVFLIFENLTTDEAMYYKLRFDGVIQRPLYQEGCFINLTLTTYAYIKPCPCLDLISNKCLIYDRRPHFCKRFKENSKYCNICKLLE